MEISVYVSKDFVNENTELFKPSNFELQRYEEKYESGKTKEYTRDYLRLDNSTKTTLNELYKNGWEIEKITTPYNFWHYFFMIKQ